MIQIKLKIMLVIFAIVTSLSFTKTSFINEVYVEAGYSQSLWFYTLILSIVVVIIFSIYQLCNRSLKKRTETLKLLVKEKTLKIDMGKENLVAALKEVQKEKEKVDNANKEKTDLMRIVAHDFKNPISAIRGSVDMIIADTADMETIKELAGIIKNATSESLEMIVQFLEQSEVEDPRYNLEIKSENIFDLVKIGIYDCNIIAERKGQEIIFDNNQHNEIFAEVDANKISSVLKNLISNAIKYSNKNEKIKITLEDIDDHIKICVIDNGPGLTEEDHKNIFGKFAKLSARPTGNETSTGLGLSIVKKIVELHRGKVGVVSTLGNGSNFFITLPKYQNKS